MRLLRLSSKWMAQLLLTIGKLRLSLPSAASLSMAAIITSEIKVRISRLMITLATRTITITTTTTISRLILYSLLSELIEGVISPSKAATIKTKLSNATKNLTNVSIMTMTLRTNSETDFYLTIKLCTALRKPTFLLTKRGPTFREDIFYNPSEGRNICYVDTGKDLTIFG